MDTGDTRHNDNTVADGVPNDASGVSDRRQTSSQQELYAVGGETEDLPSNKLAEDVSKPQEDPSAQQPSQFHEGDNWEICNCTKGTDVAYVNGVKCPICGKVINLVVEESAPATSTSETESAFFQTLATGMVMVPQTPEPSPGDQSATTCEAVDQQARCAVRQDGSKIAIESHSEPSVQMPCLTCGLTLFILKKYNQETNDQQFSIYFADDFQERRVPSWIKQMEERLGFKLVSFGDEQFSQRDNQYFHHICLEDGVTLKFELIQQIHRKFRIRDAQAVQKIPLHHIKALCQHRIRGATALVCIESLCGPGEVSQSHLRMTVEYGQTIRKMLIPIWSSGQP